MSAYSQRVRELCYVGNGVAALAVSACLLAVLGTGLGRFPALGRALVPSRGAWTSAAGTRLPESEALTLAGLTDPVQVTFTDSAGLSVGASQPGLAVDLAAWTAGDYLGGQSENPTSPWYADQTGAWPAGGYLPMPWAAGTAAPTTWQLQP